MSVMKKKNRTRGMKKFVIITSKNYGRITLELDLTKITLELR